MATKQSHESLLAFFSPLFFSLLSSSCCIIQLALNVFSFSCAGFSVLTPYRPLFTALTTISLIYTCLTYGLTRRTLLIITFSLFLFFSPELIQNINEGTVTLAPSLSHEEPTNFLINITGISCNACANRIKNSIEKEHFVYEAKVFFDNRSAIVVTNTKVVGEKGIVWVSERIIEAVKGLEGKYVANIMEIW